MHAVHPLNIVWTPLSAGRTFPLALALRSGPPAFLVFVRPTIKLTLTIRERCKSAIVWINSIDDEINLLMLRIVVRDDHRLMLF